MTRLRWVVLVVVLLALGLVGPTTAARGPNKPPPGEAAAVPGELIVGFRAAVPESQRDAALARVEATEKSRLAKLNAKVVRIAPGNVERALKLLDNDPRVLYAEPNYLVYADGITNDPGFAQLWGVHNTGQTVNGKTGTADADIDAVEAWDAAAPARGVVVGVIDTGVDFSHPDLGGSMATSALMWTNADEIAGNGVDDDGNGYVDDWRGWDFANNDNNPQDDDGHGTHVAGTIAALAGNGVGIAGVARNAKVMALKFLGADGTGTTEDAVRAILYATAEGAHVTNNSWGGGSPSHALKDAIAQADRAGSTFVAAAGNSTADNDSAGHWPSNSAEPNVISVAATDQNDGLSYFSNFGRKTVDIGAPGSDIYSSVLGGGYDWWSGTSMATPHVAGAIAFLRAIRPGATGAATKALVLRTGDAKSSLTSWTTTGARLNLNSAARCSGAPQLWLDSPANGFDIAVGETLRVNVLAGVCGEPAGATVTATVNGAALPLVARGDGLHTGTYTAMTAGTLTVSATASAGGGSDTRQVTGNVRANYRYADEPFAWLDATAGGTRLSLGDDASATVSLPFSFTFYKQAFTSLKVASNGYVVFGGSAATAYSNTAIPTLSAPNGYAAPFWDDLNPTAGGAVWYRTVGASPNRKFVVSWIDVPHYSSGTNGVTFQVVLEEGTNDVVYSYKDTFFGQDWLDNGGSATTGVENLDATVGRQFAYNEAGLDGYDNRMSIRWTDRVASDTTPPPVPTALAATGAEGAVDLDWADVGASDLREYRVYRNAGGGWTHVGSVGASAYRDVAVTATTYSYRVTAVDTSGNESAPSNEATATPTADVTPPAAPASLTAVGGDRKVTLDWADNRETDLAGYRVYRSDGSTWLLKASPGTSAYADTGLEMATTYSYRVTAVDRSGNESVGATASATTDAAPVAKTYQPSSYSITRGSLYAGGLSSLFSDDASRLQISAVKAGGRNYVAEFHASATITAADRASLTSLSVAYDGHASAGDVSLTLLVYNWYFGTWEAVEGPTTGVTSDRAFTWTETAWARDYVSSNGEIRFRVRGQRSYGGFQTRTDLIRFTIGA